MSRQLSPADRNFFNRINRILFTNPFLVDTDEIRALLDGEHCPHHFSPHPFVALIPPLEARFRALAAGGRDSLRVFEGEDRELLRYAYLFHLYHRHTGDFDALIRTELAQGKTPEFPAAQDILAALAARGFNRQEALRHLALFWQLRRAYYFIDTALLGCSPCMQQLRYSLWNNVFTVDARLYDRYLWNRMEDFSTLILGETGTGKGQAAAAIGRSGYIPFDERQHRFAISFTDAFTTINLSEFPETLIESELFGHRKGAFTGAVDHHQGVFERCSEHGALLLDEIGDASLSTQIKLLRVLQDREFSPVGSHNTQRFAGRVIAATHQALDVLRSQGRFREDFFYRLSADIIHVPSLRERLLQSPEELPLLVDSLVARTTGQQATNLNGQVLATLERDVPQDYPWPGNVRELAQAVRRILLTGRYTVQGEADNPFLRQLAAGELDARGALAGYCQLLYQRLGSYEAVARHLDLDRRTVKKYLQDTPPASLSKPQKG